MPTPKRPPAFQFYPDAWLGSVSVETMPPEVEGTYIRLLARQWLSVSLPADPKLMQKLTKLTPAQWRKAWPLLEPHFPLVDEGAARRNPTLAAVHEAREAFRTQSAERGRVGAEKRWGGHEDPTPKPPRKAKGPPSRNGRVPHADPMPENMGSPSFGQWGTDDSVSGSVTDTPPTAADAAVSPPGGAATATATAREELLGRFANPLHRDAAAGYVRAAQHPDSVVAHLDGLLSGLSAPNMQPIAPEVLGQALHEMRVAGIARLTPNAVSGFVVGKRTPVTAGTGERPKTEAEIEADFMARIERGDFLPPELRETTHG